MRLLEIEIINVGCGLRGASRGSDDGERVLELTSTSEVERQGEARETLDGKVLLQWRLVVGQVELA